MCGAPAGQLPLPTASTHMPSAVPHRSGAASAGHRPADRRPSANPWKLDLRELGRRPGSLQEIERTAPAPAEWRVELIGGAGGRRGRAPPPAGVGHGGRAGHRRARRAGRGLLRPLPRADRGPVVAGRPGALRLRGQHHRGHQRGGRGPPGRGRLPRPAAAGPRHRRPEPAAGAGLHRGLRRAVRRLRRAARRPPGRPLPRGRRPALGGPHREICFRPTICPANPPGEIRTPEEN